MTPTSRPKVKPMLASSEKPDLATIRYPKLASVKLDGCRCYIDFDGPKGRAGDLIPNPHVRALLAQLPVGLDGELVVLDEKGACDFRATGAFRREVDKKGKPLVFPFEYRVFDLWQGSQDFVTRYASLVMAVEAIRKAGAMEYDRHDRPKQFEWLKLVEHFWVEDQAEADAAFRGAISAGEEGIILRDPEGLYKMGRATLKSEAMLKVKPYEDAEAVIVGVTERMHSTAEKTRGALGQAKRSKAKEFREGTGLVGAFVCLAVEEWAKYPPSMQRNILEGKSLGPVEPFEVAAGKLSHEESAAIYANRASAVGRIIRYQHLTVGGYDSVRSGTFQGFREKWDMGE